MKLWFFRTLRELFNPGYKCLRIGHRLKVEEYTQYEYPSTGFRSVADEVTYHVSYCNRCGFRDMPTEVDRDSLQGLTLDAGNWRRLRRDGHMQI